MSFEFESGVSGQFGQEDVAHMMTNLMRRIAMLEDKTQILKEVMRSMAQWMMNSIFQIASRNVGEMAGRYLLAIPYIGPFLSVLFEGFVDFIFSVPTWDLEGGYF